MKKYIFKIISILISFISISVYSNAADKTSIELVPDTNSIEAGNTVAVKVNIKEQDIGISAFDCFINYDETIFEELTEDDISTDISENYIDTFTYNKNTKKIVVTLSEHIENIETIITINFKSKESVESIEGSNIFLSHMNLYNSDEDIFLIEDEDSEILKVNVNKVDVTNEKLYLSSEKYKIGTENIYNVGDEYITKISPETTIETFLNNLETNGNITLYSKDEIEESNINELVKTGMKIKVSKNGSEDINLTLVVIGDIDGNGKVTVTDLAAMNQHVLKDINLEGAQLLSADISDNQNITVTDLAAIISLILKEILL